MKKILYLAGVSVWILACLLCAGCGPKTNSELSPSLVSASVSSYSEDTEDSQYVQVDLRFDKEISVASQSAESMRITIAGERVREDECTLSAGEDSQTAVLKISVDAITKGVLEIQRSEKADTISDIRDADGKYAVLDFTVQAIIPSGVTLSDVSSGDGRVVKNVDSAWNIRSIAWVGLTKDGELQPVSEKNANEVLDGYAAVHGHEFLMEDEERIAEKIAETLTRVYPDGYSFSADGTQVTARCTDGSGGALDIVIYQYLYVNGQEVSADNASQNGEEETAQHGGKDIIKVSEKDRTPSAEEGRFLNALHISQETDSGIRDGGDLYTALTITGDAMPEEEIYSVKDIEELLRLSFENSKMDAIGLPLQQEISINGQEEMVYGMDLLKFLELCGMDTGQDALYMTYQYGGTGRKETVDLKRLTEAGASVLLSTACSEGPYTDGGSVMTGPATLIITDGDNTVLADMLEKLTINRENTDQDPEYQYHNREPYTASLEKTFTIEVYEKGSEYLGAVSSRSYTTEEFEKMMRENPDHVVKNYYGTIGNEEDFSYMGVGGWLDYFEGLDLKWLLQEAAGTDSLKGSAKLVGRDGQVYGTIEDLSYFENTDPKDYYILTSEGEKIPGAVPMIACVKNGYPMLPEHDHESVGYVAYNHMNQQLEKLGIETEVGVVKNHNGPFTACLGNYSGLYGGEKTETGGDCIQINLYLE